MKKKIVMSVIFGVLICLLLSTLFFSRTMNRMFRLSPDLSNIADNAFEVHFIDVGQGDAIAIRFPDEKTMLVDSGPVTNKKNFEEYLDKVFFKDNYDTFDYVFLTHSDFDHAGNMEYIFKNYKIKNFYRPLIYSNNLEPDIKDVIKTNSVLYDNLITLAKDKNIPTHFVANEMVIDTGEATITIFLGNPKTGETNDQSPMMFINSNSSTVCLTGDVGEEVEIELVGTYNLPKVDLFKLGHHGSKYSNTMALLEEICPKYVACSVGYNTYGHPANDTLLRLADMDKRFGTTMYSGFLDTYNDGNLVYFKNPNEEMSVITINKVGDFVFIEWYVVVITGSVVLIVVYIMMITPLRKIIIRKKVHNSKL